MARASWEMEAELAGGSSSKPRGRALSIFTALAFVAMGTFVAAFYLPLVRTHKELGTLYTQTADRLRASEQKVASAESALRAASAERDELKSFRAQTEANANQRVETVRSLHASLTDSLKASVERGQLSVAQGDGYVELRLVPAAFFGAKGFDLSVAGRTALCGVAKALGGKRVAVVASSDAAAKDAFSKAAEGGARVVEALAERCGVPPALLSMTIEASRIAASSTDPSVLLRVFPE